MSTSNALNHTFDLIVVGAGSTGCVLTNAPTIMIGEKTADMITEDRQ